MRSITRLTRNCKLPFASLSVPKGRDDGTGPASCVIAALSNVAEFKGDIDVGIKVLIGEDSPWHRNSLWLSISSESCAANPASINMRRSTSVIYSMVLGPGQSE